MPGKRYSLILAELEPQEYEVGIITDTWHCDDTENLINTHQNAETKREMEKTRVSVTSLEPRIQLFLESAYPGNSSP